MHRMSNARPILSRVRRSAKSVCRQALERAGYDVTPRHFYSPLPNIDALPRRLWDGPSAIPGVDLRVDDALVLLHGPLKPYLDEFRPQLEPGRIGRFCLNNGSYGSVDAETLYALLRHVRPERVYELGSGSSSHVIHEAALANQYDDRPMAHTIFDPFPFQASHLGPVAACAVRETRTEDLEPAEFAELRSGDVLFVDTTHTVRTGGDVTHIFLEILPRLAQGVIVHVHDIFLPYEYPKEWVIDRRRAWAEQYLLQAFLAFNGSYEVLMPNYAVARTAPDALAVLIPSFDPATVHPGGFWIRRTKDP